MGEHKDERGREREEERLREGEGGREKESERQGERGSMSRMGIVERERACRGGGRERALG